MEQIRLCGGNDNAMLEKQILVVFRKDWMSCGSSDFRTMSNQITSEVYLAQFSALECELTNKLCLINIFRQG